MTVREIKIHTYRDDNEAIPSQNFQPSLGRPTNTSELLITSTLIINTSNYIINVTILCDVTITLNVPTYNNIRISKIRIETTRYSGQESELYTSMSAFELFIVSLRVIIMLWVMSLSTRYIEKAATGRNRVRFGMIVCLCNVLIFRSGWYMRT